MSSVLARLERALAALDARDSLTLRDGALMALHRSALFSSFENDAPLLHSWNQSSAARDRPFVEVIPLRSSIDASHDTRSVAGTLGVATWHTWHEGSVREPVLSREELARAHQQFLESLPPRDLKLFSVSRRS